MFKIEFKNNGLEYFPNENYFHSDCYMAYNSITMVTGVYVNGEESYREIVRSIINRSKDSDAYKKFYFIIKLSDGKELKIGDEIKFLFNGKYYIEQNISIWSYFRKEISWSNVWRPSMIINPDVKKWYQK